LLSAFLFHSLELLPCLSLPAAMYFLAEETTKDTISALTIDPSFKRLRDCVRVTDSEQMERLIRDLQAQVQAEVDGEMAAQPEAAQPEAAQHMHLLNQPINQRLVQYLGRTTK